MGAELEMSMVDGEGLALPFNQEVLADCNDSHTQLELDSFNLEYNFTPGDVAGTPFANMQNQITLAMESLDSFARRYDGRVVSIGILPTLRRRDLTHDAVTDVPRFHALAAGPEAWNAVLVSLQHPAYLAFHVFAFLVLVWVAWRFLIKLSAKAQPVKIGPLRPPPAQAIPPLMGVLWLGASALMVVVLWGIFP